MKRLFINKEKDCPINDYKITTENLGVDKIATIANDQGLLFVAPISEGEFTFTVHAFTASKVTTSMEFIISILAADDDNKTDFIIEINIVFFGCSIEKAK